MDGIDHWCAARGARGQVLSDAQEDVWNQSRSGSQEAVDTSGRGTRGDPLFPQMVLPTVWFSKILVGVLRRQTQKKEGRRETQRKSYVQKDWKMQGGSCHQI